jgi:uncharacterized small protein (DUF1192 family)
MSDTYFDKFMAADTRVGELEDEIERLRAENKNLRAAIVRAHSVEKCDICGGIKILFCEQCIVLLQTENDELKARIAKLEASAEDKT